jgi:hypothetical protein
MKNLSITVLLLVIRTFSAEQVTMTCKLDAIASGYTDKSYSVNLILSNDKLFNQDGSIGEFQQNEIFGEGDYWFDFRIFDGDKFRNIDGPSEWKIGQITNWTMNIGNLSCYMKKGWIAEKQFHNRVIRDTVEIPQFKYTTVFDTIFVPEIKVIHDTIFVPEYKIIRDTIFKPFNKTVHDTFVEGTRSPASILQVIRNHQGGFQYIFEKHLRKNYTLGGRIAFKFTINPEGDITTITVVESNTSSLLLDEELKKRASQMKFDRIEKGDVTVTYAIVLNNK